MNSKTTLARDALLVHRPAPVTFNLSQLALKEAKGISLVLKLSTMQIALQ